MAGIPKTSRCPHVMAVGCNTWEDISNKKKEQSTCMSCEAKGPNLWLCLHFKCLYVGCGESGEDHSSTHSETNNHTLTMNLTTMRIWCYKCEFEVYKDDNDPPLLMREKNVTMSPNTPSLDSSSARLSPKPQFQEESESDDEDENLKPRGLTGLQNIGNTCYLNAALQALSNCPPLSRFFLDCAGQIRPEKKPMLSRSYLKLISEMWHKRRPSYVVPSSVVHGIKMVHPMFRGYTQQDTQEFLRCFMDQIHEELKETVIEVTENNESGQEESESSNGQEEGSVEMLSPAESPHPQQVAVETNSQSDTDYETCDSGLSSERSSVEHNLSSCEEGTATREVKLAEHPKSVSAPDIANNTSTPKTKNNKHNKKDKNRVNPDDSAISSASSVSTIHQAEVKTLKETVNIAHKQAAGDVAEAKPEVKVNDEEGSDTASVKLKEGRLRHLSETDKASASFKTTPDKRPKKKKAPQYRSVISDVFDGRILSSVQCLTCERVSSTKETFQDLSLPIPTKDHLHMIHASQTSGTHKGTCTDVSLNQGWLSWMFGWFRSLFWGPMITLQDCLAAFFSADELKGDNMYSCDKCKKLRNGVKYSKVMKLPEILCIHLKRFRHEFMFSTKIGSYVSFPLEDLDMSHYLHKDSADKVTMYDLVAVICHHGTAGGGHYTAYALNYLSEKWYEFDDQYVTEVDFQQVENCEAYVLFYRKKNETMMTMRQKANQIMQSPDSDSIMRFYISRQWLNKFNTFAEPGPITNHDFLCKHGGVAPAKWDYVGDLVQEINQPLWEYFHCQYGGGPAVSCLYQCKTCLAEMEDLKARQRYEMETFITYHDHFQSDENPGVIYGISLNWFKEWEHFVRGRVDEPPGPIDNSRITLNKNGLICVKQNADHGQLSHDMWHFLLDIYGGGPEIILKHLGNNTTQAQEASRSPEKV